MESLSFFAEGTPVPQGSLQGFRHRYTGRVMMPQSDKLLSWRRQVFDSWVASGFGDVCFSGPVSVELNFVMERPKSHFRSGKFAGLLSAKAPKFHIVRPDLDKLVRAVLDALGGAVKGEQRLFADDSQVVWLTASKRWAEPGDNVGVRVAVGSSVG